MIPSASSAAVAALLALVATACTRDAWIGAERQRIAEAGASPTPQPDAAAPDANTADASPAGCTPVECAGAIYACGNCRDDDGDGKIDMQDPECLSPCQDDERTFANVRPGQGHGACSLDCYFDQDEGSGNDGCVWSHKCDPLSVAPNYPPEGMACAYDPNAKLKAGGSCDMVQSSQCNAVCGDLTPNGCDCFGCCSVPSVPGLSVFLGSVDDAGNPSCDLEHTTDPTRCKPCTQVPSCTKGCGECQLCFAKRELPASCKSSSDCVVPECRPGVQPCGADCLPPCPDGLSCVTGCCIVPPR